MTAALRWHDPGTLADDPGTLDLLLERVLATGRCHWQAKDGPVLRLGPERPGRIDWALNAQGAQLPVVTAEEPGLIALPAASPWYVDPEAAVAGRLAFAWPRAALAALLEAPPVEPAQVPFVRDLLATKLGGLPPPAADVVEEVRKEPPQPCLTLVSEPLWRWAPLRPGDMRDLALLRFDYAGISVEPADPRQSLRRAEGNRVVVTQRHAKAERAAERRLRDLGLHHPGPVARTGEPAGGKPFMSKSGLEADWWRLVHQGLPQLRVEGWRVTIEPSFRHRVLEAAGDWEADLGETAGAWFSLDLGVLIDGERVPLLPVLAQAMQHLEPGPDGRGRAEIPPGTTLYARLADGRIVALPADRVRPMLETLIELFDLKALSADGKLDISLSQALALAEHEAALQLRWLGGERLAELASRLRGSGRSSPRPSRRRACGRPCAPTSATGWHGCSSSPGSGWAGSSPTTWASARRSRRSRTS